MEVGGVDSTILSLGMSHKKAPLIIWMILQNPNIILPRRLTNLYPGGSFIGKSPLKSVYFFLGHFSHYSLNDLLFQMYSQSSHL